jgi:hypothetical protein
MRDSDDGTTAVRRWARYSVLLLCATLFAAFLGAEIYGWITVRPNMGRGPSLSEYRDVVVGYVTYGGLAGLASLIAIAVAAMRALQHRRAVDVGEVGAPEGHASAVGRGPSFLKWSLIAVPPVAALGCVLGLYLLMRLVYGE